MRRRGRELAHPRVQQRHTQLLNREVQKETSGTVGRPVGTKGKARVWSRSGLMAAESGRVRPQEEAAVSCILVSWVLSVLAVEGDRARNG